MKPNEQTQSGPEPKIGKTLADDLRRGGFFDTVRDEFLELKEFMLTDERKERLVRMNRVKRWLFIIWWLLKSMFLKLTPARRLLLVIALLASIQITWRGERGNPDFNMGVGLTGVILLFILMLELKDKLVARKELETGRAVQEALMPERTPEVPGWKLWLFTRSANEVGGDLVDFIKVSDSRYGIALGDVAGKGLRAALLTAKLQAILRAIIPDFTSLSDLGKKLNQIFYRDRLPNIFASIVYLEIQPGTGTVRIMNAGHFLPLILRGSAIERLEKAGPALGILPDATFNEQQVELQSTQLILVYTDGLTEARNEKGEFFGEQRLLDLLPRISNFTAEQLGVRLVEEVDRFVGRAKAHDDLSIAILGRS